MNFEKVLENRDVNEIAESELADQIEHEKISEIQKEISAAMHVIYRTELFDEEYLNHTTLIAEDKDSHKKYSFTRTAATVVDWDTYHIDDFIRGRRRDFVGIYPRDYFENFMEKAFEQKIAFEVAFFDDVITYEEFIAHEIAHNDFDIKYFQRFGEYEKDGDKTDVTDEYRAKIKSVIMPLVSEKFPRLKIGKFSFERQQIAEIYAFLYQREFSRRSGVNTEVHKRLDEKSLTFFEDPVKMLQQFNQENNHKFTMEGQVYKESHVLSLIVAKLLEDKYPKWEDRINIF